MSKKDVIRILRETFSILKKYPLIFVPYLGLAVFSLVLSSMPIREFPQEFPGILDSFRGVYMGGWVFLLSFIEIFVIAITIIMTYTFHREKVRVPLQKALGGVRSKALRLIGVEILSSLISLIAFLIGLVQAMIGVSLELTVLEHIGEFIFFVLLILLFIFFAFVYQGVIIDNMGVIETFKNSYKIAKDNFWTIIGIVLAPLIFFSILSMGIIGIISVIYETQMFIMDIIDRIFSHLFYCYLTAALTLFYISRKLGND